VQAAAYRAGGFGSPILSAVGVRCIQAVVADPAVFPPDEVADHFLVHSRDQTQVAGVHADLSGQLQQQFVTQ
jgi:hypothetical protein